jgi:hypothetical protein
MVDVVKLNLEIFVKIHLVLEYVLVLKDFKHLLIVPTLMNVLQKFVVQVHKIFVKIPYLALHVLVLLDILQEKMVVLILMNV